MKQLQTEISAEESQLKKTGRAVEVMRTSLKALEERVRELEREKKEAGSTMDTAHLKKLETQVQGFERGEGGGEGGGGERSSNFNCWLLHVHD